MSELPLFGSRLTCGCQIMLVKRLSDQGLYYCLAADVQFFCRVVQFVEHWRREVYIHPLDRTHQDRKSTRLNSSHVSISYAVFCLKKKNKSLRSSYNFCNR